jgi:hypothetical protein
VAIGIQSAAFFNSVVLLLLILTARWWLRPWRAEPVSAGGKVRTPSSKVVIFGLLVVTLIGTGLRLPLASKSLWWDELWAIRQCSHGSWKVDAKSEDPEAMRFSPTTWKRCAFYYQKPTNHVPMSLLQKASLDLARKVSGGPRHEFSDLAARVPALILSAGAVFLTGWLLLAWGAGPVGALAGALLLAVHPTAIRYGVDARGYALVMPLVLSALLIGTRLVRSGGRDSLAWIGLAVNQCVWLWAFPHGVLDVAVMTLVLAVLLVRAQSNGADRVAVCVRLVVAHVCSGLLFIQLFLPNLLQARHWAGQEGQGHVLDADILKDTLSRLLTGLRWREPAAGSDLGEGLPQLITLWGPPAVGITLLVIAGALVLWNVLTACRRGDRVSWLVAGLLVSGVLFALLTKVVGTYYYSRFAIALVPGVVLGLTLGWGQAGRLGRLLQGGVWLALIVTGLRGDEVLLKRPIEPIRDVAEWLADAGAGAGSGANGAAVLGYGHGREALTVFVPRLIPVDDAAQIQQELERAQSQGRSVFVVVGHFHFNRAMLPTGFPVFEEVTRFNEVARFDGIESENHYRIYQARH